jgi:hypothetical protein
VLVCTNTQEDLPKDEYLNDKLDCLKRNIEDNLKKFLENYDIDKSTKWKYARYCQYVFQVKHHTEIVDYIRKSHCSSLESFEYLILPKTMIEYPYNLIK